MGSRSYAVLMASLSQQEMLGSAKEKEGFFMIGLELYDYNGLRLAGGSRLMPLKAGRMPSLPGQPRRPRVLVSNPSDEPSKGRMPSFSGRLHPKHTMPAKPSQKASDFDGRHRTENGIF